MPQTVLSAVVLAVERVFIFFVFFLSEGQCDLACQMFETAALDTLSSESVSFVQPWLHGHPDGSFTATRDEEGGYRGCDNSCQI